MVLALQLQPLRASGVTKPSLASTVHEACLFVGTGCRMRDMLFLNALSLRGNACRYCSRAGDEEGPICGHGSDVIRTDHWSCCGVGERQAACTKVRECVSE